MKTDELFFLSYGPETNKNHCWILKSPDESVLQSEPHKDFNSMLCHCVYKFKRDILDREKITLSCTPDTKQRLFVILNNLYPEAP